MTCRRTCEKKLPHIFFGVQMLPLHAKRTGKTWRTALFWLRQLMNWIVVDINTVELSFFQTCAQSMKQGHPVKLSWAQIPFSCNSANKFVFKVVLSHTSKSVLFTPLDCTLGKLTIFYGPMCCHVCFEILFMSSGILWHEHLPLRIRADRIKLRSCHNSDSSEINRLGRNTKTILCHLCIGFCV